MSDIAEALDAIAAAKAETDLPVICSMTFDESGRTFMGVAPEEFAKAATGAGADAVGANCSLGPAGMLPVVSAILEVAGDVPVIAQPNAGLPRVDGDRVYYDIAPEEFADDAYRMVEAGVKLIGGCCGTTPDMIAMLKGRMS
jgi:5-methyltetrahydrofolate--homocysteine methyltransferase